MSYFSDSTVCTLFVLILIVGFFMGLATGHSTDPTVMNRLKSLEDEISQETYGCSFEELDTNGAPSLHYYDGYPDIQRLIVELRVQNYLKFYDFI